MLISAWRRFEREAKQEKVMSEFDYELFAIRYATRDARRGAHFIGGDPHDGPMPMDYFVWVAKGGGRTFVIDTGFNADVSEKRKRTFLRCPVEGLTALGIDADTVEDVILTHLHYDHVGNFDRFPKARFHLQERTGLCHRAVHALSAPVPFVRGRGRMRDRAAELCGASDVLQRRRGACAWLDGACGGRPFGGASIRPGQDPPRICRARLRRHAFLREHGKQPAVHDGLPYRRNAGGL